MSTSQVSVQTATARRLAEAELRRLVAKFAPAHQYQRLVGAMRRSLRKRLPTAHEVVCPEKLLQGSANARWILLEGASTTAGSAVARLMDEAVARNRVPFARIGRGPVIIRSATAKPRPAPVRPGIRAKRDGESRDA